MNFKDKISDAEIMSVAEDIAEHVIENAGDYDGGEHVTFTAGLGSKPDFSDDEMARGARSDTAMSVRIRASK